MPHSTRSFLAAVSAPLSALLPCTCASICAMETVDSDTVFGAGLCACAVPTLWDQSDEEESGVCATPRSALARSDLDANLPVAGAKSHLGWRRRRFGGYKHRPSAHDCACCCFTSEADAPADAYADASPSAAVLTLSCVGQVLWRTVVWTSSWTIRCHMLCLAASLGAWRSLVTSTLW